jgi:TolB-like protein
LAQPQRKLAAIAGMDMAGYARLMDADEAGTLARMRALRSDLIEPALARHGGRIVKTTGDGFLLEFASAVAALQCMVEVQDGTAAGNAAIPTDRRILFRVGLHIGDILVEDGDIFGDGVNVAARLESLATPGAVYLSQAVHDAVLGKVDAKFVALGEHRLKNMSRPVRIYSIGSAADAAALVPPDRPSIVVLPFANLGGDPEQEYFADGMVEDVITALSRFNSLFVIARNSSFAYKGRSVDIRQVARELGVRYALEGSLRRSGNRLRVNARLLDCESNAQLWTERFEGVIDDIFELQDQVAARAAGTIARKLDRAEFERARRTPVENLDAYDCYLRAQALFHKLTRDSCEETRRLCSQALALAPDYAAPAALLANCHGLSKIQFWTKDAAADAAEVRQLAARVAETAGDDALALCRAGQALGWVSGDIEAGAALIDRGLALNPNLAIGWWARGAASLYLGELERSAEEFSRCLRLNPVDPNSYQVQSSMAFVQALLGRDTEALDYIGRALARQPNSVQVVTVAAFAHVRVGNVAQARRFVAHLAKIAPRLKLGILPAFLPFQRRDIARLVEGLRTAGLRE